MREGRGERGGGERGGGERGGREERVEEGEEGGEKEQEGNPDQVRKRA